MRVIACILATFAVTASALADGWKEYADPTYAFVVSFPGDPKVETTTYPAPDDQMVAARVYSVTQEGGAFTMTVADLSDTGLAEQAVIDNAIKTLAQEGEIKLNIPARVSRVFGRQLSILRADGSRSSVALFYHEGRLYQIEGKSLAAAVADLHRQRLERADGRAPAKKSWRSRRSWSAARSRGAAAALSAIRVMPPRVAVSRRPCARRSIKAAGRIMCH